MITYDNEWTFRENTTYNKAHQKLHETRSSFASRKVLFRQDNVMPHVRKQTVERLQSPYRICRHILCIN